MVAAVKNNIANRRFSVIPKRPDPLNLGQLKELKRASITSQFNNPWNLQGKEGINKNRTNLLFNPTKIQKETISQEVERKNKDNLPNTTIKVDNLKKALNIKVHDTVSNKSLSVCSSNPGESPNNNDNSSNNRSGLTAKFPERLLSRSTNNHLLSSFKFGRNNKDSVLASQGKRPVKNRFSSVTSLNNNDNKDKKSIKEKEDLTLGNVNYISSFKQSKNDIKNKHYKYHTSRVLLQSVALKESSVSKEKSNRNKHTKRYQESHREKLVHIIQKNEDKKVLKGESNKDNNSSNNHTYYNNTVIAGNSKSALLKFQGSFKSHSADTEELEMRMALDEFPTTSLKVSTKSIVLNPIQTEKPNINNSEGKYNFCSKVKYHAYSTTHSRKNNFQLKPEISEPPRTIDLKQKQMSRLFSNEEESDDNEFKDFFKKDSFRNQRENIKDDNFEAIQIQSIPSNQRFVTDQDHKDYEEIYNRTKVKSKTVHSPRASKLNLVDAGFFTLKARTKNYTTKSVVKIKESQKRVRKRDHSYPNTIQISRKGILPTFSTDEVKHVANNNEIKTKSKRINNIKTADLLLDKKESVFKYVTQKYTKYSDKEVADKVNFSDMATPKNRQVSNKNNKPPKTVSNRSKNSVRNTSNSRDNEALCLNKNKVNKSNPDMNLFFGSSYFKDSLGFSKDSTGEIKMGLRYRRGNSKVNTLKHRKSSRHNIFSKFKYKQRSEEKDCFHKEYSPISLLESRVNKGSSMNIRPKYENKKVSKKENKKDAPLLPSNIPNSIQSSIPNPSHLDLNKTFTFAYDLFSNLNPEKDRIVVVVDDDGLCRKANKKLVDNYLKANQNLKYNYSVIRMADGIDTVNLIVKESLCPESFISLIISDENMPVMNGSESFQIIDKLAKQGKGNKNVVKVICTALDSESALENIKQISNCLDIVNKPVNKMKIEVVLKKYLE